jgi:Ca2+-binding EF-hand superfamily protein
LGELEFYRACERVGFSPPAGVTLKDIWRYADQDTSGLADFSDFNPSVAMELMRFRGWIEDLYGPGATGIRRMIRKMDANKSGRISWKEFFDRCQWHDFNASTKQLGKIFKHLDFNNTGSLAPEHIQLLGTWEPPRYRLGEPNHTALGELKDMLFEKFGHSPLRAWRYGLDKDCSMRVCYKEFEAGARQILGEDVEFDLAGAWLALDQDSSGFLALEEFDEDAYNALVQFKTWCKERHRGVNRAWKVIDKEGTDRLTKKELQRACRPGVPSETVAIIFDGLSRDKILRLRHIRFLDHWDVDADRLTSEVLKEPATSRPAGLRAKLQRASAAAASRNVWMRMFPLLQKPTQDLPEETSPQSPLQDLRHKLSSSLLSP